MPKTAELDPATTATEGNHLNSASTVDAPNHAPIEVWINTCRRCALRTAWLTEDAEYASAWGDVWNFTWERVEVTFGSLEHELAVWNHSRMWDADPLPRVPSPHDECWIVFGYVQ